MEKYGDMVDEDYDMPDIRILDGIQRYHWTFTQEVKTQLKEKLKDLTVEEVIKKVQAETKFAYKAAAKKKFAGILDGVLA